ncbi:MAG: hypothetical protein L3J20_09905 [Flavobacteriaceae bacterium]|nr:hypothetical protein [Flavobacteriaceae bacterium]
MDIKTNWNSIRIHFSKSFKSSLHVSIASVDVENSPTVTPIGSLFLNNNQTGFYFEKFPSKLPKHTEQNKNICVLGVNSNRWFWTRSLFKVAFKEYPAVKLYGVLGERRKATEKEVNRLARRMRLTQKLKGHKYLWSDMEMVRELIFTKAEKINLGRMTTKL